LTSGTEPSRSSELEKLGFRLTGFRDWPVVRALHTLAGLGFRSVELSLDHPELDPETLTGEQITRVQAALADYRLRLSAVAYHPVSDCVDTAFRRQKRALAVAREFGASALVAGGVASARDSQGTAGLKALEDLVLAAEGAGLTVALEPAPDTVLDGMYEFANLARRLAGLPVSLTLNLGHVALTEGESPEVIEEWCSFITQVHVHDVIRPDPTHLLPGDGHLDLLRPIQKLRECGYTGDLTLDLYDIAAAPDEWAARAMERCRGLFG